MMRNEFYSICILMLMLISVVPLSAQVDMLAKIDGKRNLLYTTHGFDNSIITSYIGYGQGFQLNSLDRLLVVRSDLSLPMFEIDLNDYLFRAGCRVSVYDAQGFTIPAELNLTLKGTQNGTFGGKSFGTELGVTPGFTANKWLIATELFWIQQWLTHIKHSDYYKKYFYDAKDGWLKTSASHFRFGIRACRSFQNKYELMFRGGYQQRGKLDDKLPPLYAIFSIGMTF